MTALQVVCVGEQFAHCSILLIQDSLSIYREQTATLGRLEQGLLSLRVRILAAFPFCHPGTQGKAFVGCCGIAVCPMVIPSPLDKPPERIDNIFSTKLFFGNDAIRFLHWFFSLGKFWFQGIQSLQRNNLIFAEKGFPRNKIHSFSFSKCPK